MSKTKSTKILSLALALVMVVAMLPTVAFAADPELVTDEGGLTVALTSVEESGTVKLGGNITVTKALSITKSMTLDLNGHQLSGTAGSGLITIVNNRGTETIALKVTDSSQGNKGSIENSAGPAISAVGKDETIQATVELDGGISIKATTQYGAVVNMGQRSKLTITNAVVDGTNAKQAVNVANNASAKISGGAFYGNISVPAGAGEKTINGGYFSTFTAEIARCIPEGYGLVGIKADGPYKDMYEVGEVPQDMKTNSEAKVKLGDNDESYVYGTLQQLVELYNGRGKTFEVMNNATLKLEGYGSPYAGTFNAANTLTISVTEGKTLTLTSTDTKVAKFVLSGGSRTVDVKAAEGYKVSDTDDAKICDVDSTSSAIIAKATVGDKEQIITKDNINSFLMNMTSETTKIVFNKDFTLSRVVDVPADAKLEIDMGGKTITSNIAEGAAIRSIAGGKVTLKNGTFDASLCGTAITLGVTASNSKPGDPVKPDTTSHGEAVIGDKAVIKGTIGVFNSSTLTMEKGSSVEADGFAICGNGAHDGTTITIKNGATVKSNTTAAIYHPQNGTLTIGDKDASGTKAPKITGVAGVVVRDGKVTVKDATITATGTEPLQVGDAKDAEGNPVLVPAGGIVLDKANGYNNAPDNKVTVEKATVTAQEGQPSVTYTEEGKVPDYSAENEKKPTDHVDVKAGTYQSGKDKADPNMAPFINDEVKNTSGLDKTGEIKETANIEDLYLVDFGYVANKADLGSSASSWTSPKGITYNASDWKDATFYWCFNRKLTNQEATGGVVVALTCNGKTYTDTCEAEAMRFAASLNNKDQFGDELGDDPITAGDYTISGGTGFDVPKNLATVHATLPKELTKGAPEITKAPTVNEEGESKDTDDYTVECTAVVDAQKNIYNVEIDATAVTEHQNENGVYGYWTGLAVKDSETHAGYWARIDGGKWQPSKPDTISGVSGYACIYFKDLGTYKVELVWASSDPTAAEAQEPGAEDEVLTFNVNVKITHGTSEKPAPDLPPASTGGGGGSGTTATVNSVKATNGSFAISDKNAKAGDTVKITPKANEGYVVDQVTVTDKNGNNITVTQNADGTYSFVMPAKSAQPVDVKVTFKLDDGEKDCPSEKFTDVDQDKWYHEGVDYAIKNGLMNGTGANTFAPDATTTRAMVVTILYRLEGEPAVTKDIKFGDVPAGTWYTDAVNWAAANGIVNGYGDGKFGPDDTITREQMAAILYRYASYKGYSVSDLANLTGYTDAASVSEWASTAMRWAVAEGLIEGTSATTLSPSGDSTRAQVATILMRFCEGVVK